MLPAPVQPRPPLLVYVDTNILFYWMLPQSHDPQQRSRQNHIQLYQEAQQLIPIFSRYTVPTNQMRMVISQWALTEIHSVLYRDFLWASGHTGRDPRKQFPPHLQSLQNTTQHLQTQINQLRNSVILEVNQPDIQVWSTALQISEECGIYAPDCLHLATAFHLGCDLLITQDIGFLNSVHHFQHGPVAQILQGLHLGMGPQNFEAYPLSPSRYLQRATSTARQYLAGLGYI